MDSSNCNVKLNLSDLVVPNSNFAFNLLVHYFQLMAQNGVFKKEDAVKINECLNHFVISQNNICVNNDEFNTVVELQVKQYLHRHKMMTAALAKKTEEEKAANAEKDCCANDEKDCCANDEKDCCANAEKDCCANTDNKSSDEDSTPPGLASHEAKTDLGEEDAPKPRKRSWF